jgi:hypothetical protein
LAKKGTQQENILTPSGHQVDKDLMKVAVKVSPSLQALIANQIDLLEMLEGKAAKNSVLIEQHRVEVLQVEEEIASAFSNHVYKKEKSKEQRLLKKGNTAVPFDLEEETGQIVSQDYDDKPASDRKRNKDSAARADDRTLEYDMYFDLESTGQGSRLPSSKYETNVHPATIKSAEVDVRRVALGASIKALQNILGRQLNELEIKALENQVDSYLA